MCGPSGRQGRAAPRGESGVSPVLGTILLVALTVTVGTGAALTATSVDLPGASPEGDMVVDDAAGDLGAGADDLVELRHRGGDAVPLDELEVVVETPNGTRLTYTDGDLELRDEPDNDRLLETGDVLVVSETPCADGGKKGDHDKGHGNDPDGYDEDNPGKSKGTRGGKKGSTDGSGDADKGHGNDADGYDEDNPGKKKQKKKQKGKGPECCDLSDVEELEVSVYHVPTGTELMGTGVNVE